MREDASNNESIRDFENWVKGELYGPRKEAERDNQMQCLTCGMMNIDPLSHTHTKETQPMSDTLQEREWCDDCHGYTHMPYCPSSESAKEASAHQPAARGGGDEWSIEGGSLVGRRRIRDSKNYWVADAASDEHAKQILAEHDEHQSLVAERERLLTTLKLVVASYVRSDDHGVAAQAARDTLAAIEQRSTSE